MTRHLLPVLVILACLPQSGAVLAITSSAPVNVPIPITAPGPMNFNIPLVNDGSTTDCGTTPGHCVPTQTILQGFKDGDVCNGKAPVFKDGATVLKFSASPPNARRYYPSGCLMFSVFQFLPVATHAGGATRRIAVTCCGSWPTMGSGTAGQTRTLSEVYNQHLSVNLPIFVSGAGDPLGGWLNGDRNQYDLVKWTDGDAGTYWRASVKASPTEGSTPQGDIVIDFYVQALSDYQNNLGGFRFMASVRQPLYNLDTPKKRGYAWAPPNAGSPASGINWKISPGGAGPATNAVIWPYGASYSFTGADSNPFTGGNDGATTTTPHTLYQGSAGNGQVVPVYVQCASCPTGISNGTFSFALAVRPNKFQFHSQGNGAGFSRQPLGGRGSGTITPVPYLHNFLRFNIAGENARYLFFKGTGSFAAETTLRAQWDRNYWHATKLIPPYDLSLTSANVPDPGFYSAYHWSPYSIGSFEQAQSAAGDQVSLGPLPNQFAVDFINQSFSTDAVVRMIGLSAGNQVHDFKDLITDRILNFATGSYTGLAATNSTNNNVAVADTVVFAGCSAAEAQGFTINSYVCFPIGYDTSISEHKPRYSAGAYLKTGELQYLDYQVEAANFGLLHLQTYSRNANFPSTKKGVVTFWGEARQAEYRSIAWDLTDIEFAALVYPFDPNNPTEVSHDGTQTGKYLNDLGDLSIQQMTDMFNPANNAYDQPAGSGPATSYQLARCVWTTYAPGLGYLGDGPEWEYSYAVGGFAWASVRGNAQATALLRKSGCRQNYVLRKFGGYHLYGYYNQTATVGSGTGIPHVFSAMGSADYQWGIDGINAYNLGGGNPGVAWTNSGSPFSTGPNRYFRHINGMPSHFVPGNGDIMLLQSVPGGLSQDSYTVRDYNSGCACFNLYLTTDGKQTVKVPTDQNLTGINNWFRYRSVANTPAADFPYTDDYVQIVRMASAWQHALLRDSDSAAVFADASRRLAKASGGPYAITHWGARWALQDHFGP